MEIKKIKKTLILVPDLRIPGGVTNYYKTLHLNSSSNISYFEINRRKSKSKLLSILTLLKSYCIVSLKLLKNQYQALVINPSLDMGKSFHRDSVFIIIARFFNIETIVFFHGWFEPYEETINRSKFKSFLFKISYGKVSRYIVLGNIFKSKLIALGVPAKTNFFIETMVADSTWLTQLNLTEKYQSFEKEIRILFLSRIEKEKGIYIAIDSFNSFLNNTSGKQATLVIAGDGPDLNAVKDYVDKNRILNITFLGHVSGNEKKEILLNSHIMILPSFTEGLPNVILEGMLYGMPIISRAVGGIPEIVKQGVNGYLTDSYDPNKFETFLSMLATDITLYKTMAERNHQIAAEKFTSEKVKARILNIIESI